MNKILIVDDTPSNRFLLRTMLTAVGYEVAECSNGQEALDFCEKERPCLVLMDVMMPVMDGIEACRRLRTKFTLVQLPVIIVTTRDESETLPEALKAGANDYLAKPINREVMLARIRSQLDLKESRSEIERVLEIQSTTAEALPQGLGIVSENGAVEFANRSLVEACGGRRAATFSEVTGTLYGGGMKEFFAGLLAEIAASPDELFDREFSAANGPVRNVQVISRPIRTGSGERLRLWLIRDLTRTRDLERKSVERVKLESVGLLVKGVAHNFNNIMGGVAGAIEILQKYVPEGERPQRAMRIARKGAEEAAALTKKLSLFSQMEMAQGAEKESDPLDDILDAVVLLNQERAGERIRISLLTPRPLPRVSMGAAGLLEVANHIISNAIEAIKGTGGIEILVNIIQDQKQVAIAFRDSGVGMEAETVPRVFEPFYTTKNVDVRNAVGIDGNGLGLWTVYNLVRMAGGEVGVQSQLGKGTTVVVSLPIVGQPAQSGSQSS